MKVTAFISVISIFIGVAGIPLVWGDSDKHEKWQEYSRRSTGVALLDNPVYQQECGDCHMAYPPGLLPVSSWSRIMSGLEDHFGDNAELDKNTHTEISEFLTKHSSDKSDYRRSRRFTVVSDSGDAGMRITGTPYFLHEHDEIPPKLVEGNKEVNSFSNCNACHRYAEQASFREQDILIPGFGRWDD